MDLFSTEKTEHIKTRTLIVHGLEDDQIPASHGIELYRRLRMNSSILLVPGGTHENLIALPEVMARIRSFIRSESA